MKTETPRTGTPANHQARLAELSEAVSVDDVRFNIASGALTPANETAGKKNAATENTPTLANKTGPVDAATQVALSESYGRLPLSFEVNEGQHDRRVQFLARGRGYHLFLTSNEAVMQLRAAERLSINAMPKHGAPNLPDKFRESQRNSRNHKSAVVRVKLNGANPAACIVGEDELPGRVNYFIGNDPKKWHTDVRTYSTVRYEQVYPGVDLVYHGNQGQFEFDFVVAPGADPNLIKLSYKGIKKLRVDESGDLVLHIGSGQIVQHKPVIYQEIAGQRTDVAGRYVMRGEKEVGFAVARYNVQSPLIIDPTLTYSTFLGGAQHENGRGLALDSAGNIYITGDTSSTDFPVFNARQSTKASLFNGSDVFITKLNASGSALVYSTYLGGPGSSFGNSIALDSSGNAYVTGGVFQSNGGSPGFPLANARQSTFGGIGDAFVTKLSASGSTLVYSTYHGGNDVDSGSSIAVDSAGNAYVGGQTDSTNFPTASPRQSAQAGNGDAFVTKFNASGSALLYSTYHGGSEFDYLTGIAVDAAGNAYVTGTTHSNNFPRANARQPSFADGYYDTFVTKFNSTGSAMLYSTYHGGIEDDRSGGIAVDSAGNAYITGWTSSNGTFPLANAQQSVFGGLNDAFVTKFNSSGSTLLYSTFLGGAGREYGVGITVDSTGNAYVTGSTDSTNFPLVQPVQAFNAGPANQFSTSDTSDVFISKLGPTNGALIFSTYLGGASYDSGIGIAAAGSSIYVTGSTNSIGDFPSTQNAFQRNGHPGTDVQGNSTSDAFVARIDTGTNTTYYLIKGRVVGTNGSVQVTLSGSATRTTTTDSNGYYSFQVLGAGGNYTVTATPPTGLSFNPPSWSFNPLNSDQTAANFTIPPPGNDNFISAQVIPAPTGVINGSNVGATIEPGETLGGFSSVWYRLHATNTGGVIVTSSSTGASDLLVVYTGSSVGGLTSVSNTLQHCSFSGCVGFAESFSTTAGTDYFIRVASSSGIVGSFQLTLSSAITISGRLTNVNGNGLSGRNVGLSGNVTANTQTGGGGVYSFAVPSGDNYTVAPNVQAVSTWLPANSISHTNLTQNVANDNFEAHFPSFTVAGAVKNSGGTVFPNVIVRLSGGASAGYATNSLGKYTSDQLNVLGNYSFTPQPFTAGGIAYNNFNPTRTDFFSILTCSQQTLPPGARCSGNDYADVNYIAIPAPAVTTSAATAITVTGATLNGNVNPNGLATSVWFEWGTDSTLNSSTATGTQGPFSGASNLTANISNLTGGTQYYFRAVGMSDGGTVTGAILTFTTTAPPRTLTVASSNPASGVSITVSPNNNNCTGNGTTKFNCTYNNNQVVSLTAPATASGNNFQKWLKDGADFANNTVANVSVTMDADHTMTAVYLTPKTIQLSLAAYSFSEGVGSAAINVTRIGDPSTSASVDYATSDTAGTNNCNLLGSGVASLRCDYEAALGTLRFASGETLKTISIPIVDDVYAEGDEALIITLSNAVWASLGSPSSAPITINDNEGTNGTNPIGLTGFFVRMHYLDFLNREPDTPGFNFWGGQINNCSPPGCTEAARISVSASFFLSIEFQQTGYLVERTYKVSYGNGTGSSTFGGTHNLSVPIVRLNEFLADTQQITQGVVVLAPGWEQKLENNKVAFFAEFVQRSRFTTAFPTTMTPAQFVDALNVKAGNVLSASERTTAINLFSGAGNTTNQTARAQAVRQVAEDADLNTAEFNRAFVLMQYFGYLRRNPNDPQDTDYTGYDFWLTKLNQFNGNYINAEMVKAFITSIEYKGRFGP